MAAAPPGEWFRGAAPLDRALAANRLRQQPALVVSHEWKRGDMQTAFRVYGLVDAAEYMDRLLTEPFPFRSRQARSLLAAGCPIATRGSGGVRIRSADAPCAFGHVVQLRDEPCYFRIDVDAHKFGCGEEVVRRFVEEALPELASALRVELAAVGAEPTVSVHCSERLAEKPSFRVAAGICGAPFASQRDMAAVWQRVRSRLRSSALVAPGVLDVNFADRRTDRMLGMSKIGEERPLRLQPLRETSDEAPCSLYKESPRVYLLRYHGFGPRDVDPIRVLPTQEEPPADLAAGSSATTGLVNRVLREMGFQPPDLREKKTRGISLFLPADGQAAFCAIREGECCAPEETASGVLRFVRPKKGAVQKHTKNASKICYWVRHGRLYTRCFSCSGGQGCDGARRALAAIPPAWIARPG